MRPDPIMDPGFQEFRLAVPERSAFQCQAAGVTYRPLKGQEPNRFHRFMQGLAFGFRWERVA